MHYAAHIYRCARLYIIELEVKPLPPLSTRGVVLRYANYRDNDRMLTILSPQYGRIDALSRGCRRPKSPLLPASELFVHGDFTLFESHDKLTVTTCAILDSFYPLRLEPYRLTCASYAASLCGLAAQPGESAEELYSLLLKALYHLAYDDKSDELGLTAAFLLCYADLAGYRPRLRRCAHCRKPLDTSGGGLFDISAGGLACAECASPGAYRLTAAQISRMEALLTGGFPEHETAETGELFDMLRRYVEGRLETTVKAGRLLP